MPSVSSWGVSWSIGSALRSSSPSGSVSQDSLSSVSQVSDSTGRALPRCLRMYRNATIQSFNRTSCTTILFNSLLKLFYFEYALVSCFDISKLLYWFWYSLSRALLYISGLIYIYIYTYIHIYIYIIKGRN